MYDPASKDLIHKLEQFTAVGVNELSRCKAYVRLLARDLPTFDSIWLDALVHRRSLTSFQANRISTEQEQTLKVGNYLLIDQIHQERFHARYLAQHIQTKRRFLIDQYRQPTAIPPETLDQFLQIRNQFASKGKQSNSVLLPEDYILDNQSLFVVNSYQRAMTARELLIRRGRFPEQLIKMITRQLLRQLAILEANKIVHGDLRISNLILGRTGNVTLLNPGVIPHLSPVWTLHVPLSFESYDTIAPEMVRQGNWTHQTDLYSAGCLLWQLACGRSPVYSADSLLKLRVHVSRSIPDVREIAPDIDSETASIIFQLTRKELDQRPGSASQLLGGKISSHASRTLIKNYVKEFEQPIIKPSKISPRLAATTAACLMFVAIFWGMGKFLPQNGMNQFLLSITGSQTETPAKSTAEIEKTNHSAWQQALPLPAPDAKGMLNLLAGKTYQARDLSAVGPLQIIATSDEKKPIAFAKILIHKKPWRVSATQLSLKNIAVSYFDAGSSTTTQHSLPPALLICQSSSLKIEQSLFQMNPKIKQSTRAIAWKPLSTTQANLGRLQLANCQFHTPGAAIMLGGPASQLQLHNCVKTGSGTLLELSQYFSGNRFPDIQCEQITLRQADSFASIHFDADTNTSPLELTITATNSVFDLSEKSLGLLKLVSSKSPNKLAPQINLLGQILLLAPSANLIGWWNPETQQAKPIEFPGIAEGVLAYEMQFIKNDPTHLDFTKLHNYEGPRWKSVPPGIDVTKLKAVK